MKLVYVLTISKNSLYITTIYTNLFITIIVVEKLALVHVSLGRDNIIGLRPSSYLSTNLIEVPQQKNISLLAQVWTHQGLNPFLSNWKDSNELGLSGDLSIEWRHFCRDLQVARVILSEEEDGLYWIGGDSSGVISVKNIYEAIQTNQKHPWVTCWKIHLWKWDIPQNIKLFFWLAINNKISTWDNLLHRGWSGPGRCILCKKESEDITHLLINCSFTRAVWDTICRHTKIAHFWSGENLCECMTIWIEAKTPQFGDSRLLEHLAC
jgi:hypothetical protein